MDTPTNQGCLNAGRHLARILQGYFYYIFGFCFVVGALTVLITVEVAIVCTYVQLCAEDYLWWYSPPHMPLLFPCTAHVTIYIQEHDT